MSLPSAHLSLAEDMEKMVIMNNSNTGTKINMCCLRLWCETGLRCAAGDPDALFPVSLIFKVVVFKGICLFMNVSVHVSKQVVQ